MGFEQYHEPADELSTETRTFARMIVSFNGRSGSDQLVRAADLARERQERAGHHAGRAERGVQTFLDGSRVAPARKTEMARDRERRALPIRRHCEARRRG